MNLDQFRVLPSSTAPGTSNRAALIAATKDTDARVRAGAINALAKSKDPTLAGVYEQFLSDQSYATVNAAATALGETKNANAYDALNRLLDVSSWRDQIRASALAGLARLEDKRALETGVRYSASGNFPSVRAAAIRLLGSVGKGDERAFTLVSQALTAAVIRGDFQVAAAAADSLVKLGDPRGIDVFEQSIKSAQGPQIQGFLKQFQQRLRQAGQPVPKASGQ